MGQGRRPPSSMGPSGHSDGKRPPQPVRPGTYNIPNAAGSGSNYMPPVGGSNYAPYTLPPPQLGQPPRIKFNVAAAKAPVPITLAAQSMSSTPYQNNSFVPPNLSPHSTTATQRPTPRTGGQWPPTLRAYVDRCFSQCRSDGDRDRTEVALKERIQVAIKSNDLYSRDWTKEPLLLPSVTTAGSNNLQKKIEQPPRDLKVKRFQSTPDTQSTTQTELRARRFQSTSDPHLIRQTEQQAKKARKSALLAMAEEGIDWDEYTIIGTSQNLEKPYLRLTAAPDPATVRPLPILRETLEMLKRKWREPGAEYNYICDQFKSLRQDLTVQRIRNEFTVTVYEIHARIALERGDLGEYNQCQAQLKVLYEQGIDGCRNEFLAYRILYLLHTRNKQEMNSLMAQLEGRQKTDPAVIHALKARSALALSDYCAFFRLYSEAPNMGGYLMDCYVKRERLVALNTICKAYRPAISISFLVSLLAFEDAETCRAFLKESGAHLTNDDAMLDTKLSFK